MVSTDRQAADRMAADRMGTRLRVFLTEDDRLGRHSVCEVLLQRARDLHMAGATIWRGVEGYGPSGNVRTIRFPDVSTGLPLVMELIDAPERVEAFLPVVHDLAPGSLVTRERVQMVDPARNG
jgi:uncharacterized protein